MENEIKDFNKENIDITIKIPKKLYELIQVMANVSNQKLLTNLTAEDMISKQVVQYFGTRNSLDIMTYTSKKYKEIFKDEIEIIDKMSEDFNETIVKLDKIATETNKLLFKVIEKLEKNC